MQLETKIALFGGVIPGVVALAALVIAWRRAGRRAGDEQHRPPRGPYWVAPLLALGAFLLADFAVNGPPSLWTPHGPARYPHAVALIAAVGVLDGLFRLPWWGVGLLRAAALAGAAWVLGSPYVPQAVGPGDHAAWMALAALGGAAVLGAVDAGARSMRGALTPIVLILTTGAAAAAVAANGLAFAAMTAAAPVAVLGAAAVASIWARGLGLERGGATTIAGIGLVWILGAVYQTGVHTQPGVVLLALAPAGLAAGWALRGRHWALRLGVSLLLAGACAGAALAATMLARPGPAMEEPDPYADWAAEYDAG